MFQSKSSPVYKNLFYGFLSSLFIHVVFWGLLSQAPTHKKRALDSEHTEVVFIEYPSHRQIVSQKTFNKIAPSKQRAYLSQADKSVEKETQAMLKGLFHQAKSSSFLGTQAPKNRKPASKNNKNRPKIDNFDVAKRQIKEAPLQMDLNESGLPFPSSSARSQTMDFLPGVELGSHTLLNTQEFRYYSYFSRMKEQLYWRWTSLFREESLALSAQIKRAYQQRLFHTSLYVYLSPEGEIQDISVVKSSGLESIDSIALYAFMQSAPFPNPPKGLVEEDGYIHIRQSFNLYIQPSMFKNAGAF